MQDFRFSPFFIIIIFIWLTVTTVRTDRAYINHSGIEQIGSVYHLPYNYFYNRNTVSMCERKRSKSKSERTKALNNIGLNMNN